MQICIPPKKILDTYIRNTLKGTKYRELDAFFPYYFCNQMKCILYARMKRETKTDLS